ncbi:MAG TPA: hypothetical protein VEZ24_19815 [Microvirga sp.]|nr:hypothetical protein [Microvirga sp.]
MKRLLSSLAFLLMASWAHAQNQPSVPTQESAGTSGDTTLILVIAVAFVVVAVGVYLFIRRGGRAGM